MTPDLAIARFVERDGQDARLGRLGNHRPTATVPPPVAVPHCAGRPHGRRLPPTGNN